MLGPALDSLFCSRLTDVFYLGKSAAASQKCDIYHLSPKFKNRDRIVALPNICILNASRYRNPSLRLP